MGVEWAQWDLATSSVTMRRSDGVVGTFPMTAAPDRRDTNLDRITWDLPAGEVRLHIDGEDLVVEMHEPGRTASELQRDRPILYLDQNHWSTLSAVRCGRWSGRRSEADAAQAISELAESEAVLLPVSAGHLVETTPLHGRRRVDLARTVLGLGRGWQMRNPLHVRVEEVARAVQRMSPVAADVFAPQADAFFSRVSPRLSEVVGDHPMAWIVQAAPAVLGLYDAVLDPEAIPDEDDKALRAASSWAGKFEALSAQLRDARESSEMVRKVAHANLVVDMLDDVLRAAAITDRSPKEVIERLTDDDDPISRSPFLGQMRQLVYARLRNAGQRWEANDLIDIMFLGCAAGYADFVVGERATIGYLRQARDPRPRAKLAHSLEDALALL